MSKKKITLLSVLFILFLMIPGYACIGKTIDIHTSISGITNDGGVSLDISREQLEIMGIEQADIIRIGIGKKEYLAVIDYDSLYGLNPGKDAIAADGSQVYIKRQYRSFAAKEALTEENIGDSLVISLVEKGSYIYNLRDVAGLDEKTAANFRCVKGGKLGAGKLYRSCSAVTTSHGEERRALADKLLEDYQIDYAINLESDLDDLTEKVSSIHPQPYYGELAAQGHVSAIELDWTDVDNEIYISKLAEHFRFISQHNGSYLVHCAIGQDRTGFMIQVLAALMGASYEELIEDYGLSFDNYYGVARGSVLYQFLTEGGLRDSLEIMIGSPDVEKYIGDDGTLLSKAAETYLKRLGLTEDEIRNIKKNLSEDGRFGEDTLSCHEAVASELSFEISEDLAYYKGDVGGTITVTNTGVPVTDINSSHPLLIGISLLDKKGGVLSADYYRLRIEQDCLAKDETIRIRYAESIRKKKARGIRVQVGQEGIAWIGDRIDLTFEEIMMKDSEWEGRLYSPTQIVQAGKWYFIEDCWHHRILYSDVCTKKIEDWNVLTENIMGGHSLASDGKYLVADDTDHDRILVFDLEDIDGSDNIDPIQEIDISPYVSKYTGTNHSARPHYVYCDVERDVFLVALSWGQKILAFAGEDYDWGTVLNWEKEFSFSWEQVFDEAAGKKQKKVLVYLTEYQLKKPTYIKFISNFDDGYWFMQGKKLIKVNWVGNELKKTDSVRIPDNILEVDINYVCKIKDTYYMCLWEESGLYTFDSLKKLKEGEIDKIGDDMDIEGIPYYITELEGDYWICYVEKDNGIISFQTDQDGMPTSSRSIFDYGDAETADLLVKRLDDVIA